MKRFLTLSTAIILSILSVNAFAATATANHQVTISIGEIAAMALSDTSLMTLAVTAPATPGDDPIGSSDSARYLRYTTLNATGANRVIQVVLSVAAPAGTALRLTGDVVGTGYGTEPGQLTLTTSSQDLITAIGSGSTGSTGANGVNLLYVLDVTTPASLIIGDTTTTVTFTLTEDL